MSNPIDRVLDAYPAIFFQRLLEHYDAAFAEALLLARNHIEEPERPNMLGQFRHARCEVAFRKAAADAQLRSHAPHTTQKGGRYSIVETKGVYLIRCNIQRHCGPPRATAFRKEKSKFNEWIEPFQEDLLDVKTPPPADYLCGMIVTTTNPRSDNQSVPSFVGLGIPWSDMSGWSLLLSLPDLIAHYNDKETEERTPKAAPVEIKDRAVPKLKKRPNENDE